MTEFSQVKMTSWSKQEERDTDKNHHKHHSRTLEYIFQQLALFYLLLSFVCSHTVFGQPLHLSPESFLCGPEHLKIACQRWGYDTCISDNEEFYCLPCQHDYLTTLCGTTEEKKGCNLFCTEKAVDIERAKLTSNHTALVKYLKTQAEISKKDANIGVKKIKMLEESLRNKTTALYAIIAVLIIVVLLFLIVAIIWYIRRKHCRHEHDVENPIPESESTPLTQPTCEENLDRVSSASEQTSVKELDVQPDSLEDITESDNKDRDLTIESEQKMVYQGCQVIPTIKNSPSYPATNTTGHNEMVISTIRKMKHEL